MAKPPQEIKQLFQQYSENDTMTIHHLLRFMIEVQKDANATIHDVQAIFKHFNTCQSRKGLHLDAFFRYLLSDLNHPLPDKVHQDMEAPLSHYFLYTGHNSYLTGNQLSSKSSVDPIIKALHQGVRVIELDLWPNTKKKNDVKVCHGGTLTSPVDLIKCLRAIRDNAFVASEYPVVITFEDHLTPDLQAQVAQMVMKVFGPMLYCPGMDCLEKFPSPESMKKRLLISTKPPEKLQNLKYLSKKEGLVTEKSNSSTDSDSTDQDQVDDGELIEEVDEENAAPEYRNLIAIHAMKLKGRLDNIFQDIVQNKPRRLSMSEQQLENAITKNHGTDIVRFTKQNLVRVYPKGMRINSSNYNPFVGWEHGAQMVAFNMQGTGKYLGIMQGMFRGNGGCGYVKKPDFLLNDDQYNGGIVPCKPKQVKTTLKVEIYLGEGWRSDFRATHFDHFSPPDFFVKVRVAGVQADKQKMRTRVVKDKWIPEWNEKFEFPLTVPELALLRISVYDFDDIRKHDFAGQTCLPVSELRRGIRAVPLHKREGDQYKHTRLLVRFDFD